MGKHRNTVARRIVPGLVLAASLSAIVPAHAADLLTDAKARGTLRIAMEGSYPPFNFTPTTPASPT